MGKWNNRWIPNSTSYWHENRGRFQREFMPLPYPAEPTQNSVPEWEKKFCYFVGLVPWRKVLNTKTFAPCYPDVMNWDNSEAKDTFHSAKKRFWAQMNGFHTDDVSLPDPNAYIDQIDWNTSVDTDLFIDLDLALLAADADTKAASEAGTVGVVDISALKHNSKLQEWDQGTADDVWDSGGGWDKSNTGGWGKPGNGRWGPVNALKDMPQTTKGAAGPWDSQPDETNVSVNNTAWGHCNDKTWGWEQRSQFYLTRTLHNVENPNGADDSNFHCRGTMKGNGWAVSTNNSWGRNHQQNNFKEAKGWVYGSVQHKETSAAREWGKHGCGDHSQFRNSWNNNQHKRTDTYYKSSSEKQDWGNRGDHKRESPNNYAPRSKSPRFQRQDNQRHDQREAVQPQSNRQSMQRAGSSFRPS